MLDYSTQHSKLNPNVKIICVHLFNDFSGSPMVMSVIINELIRRGHSLVLFTSNPPRGGLLSGLTGIEYQYISFNWHSQKFLNLIFYLWAQIQLFVRLIRYKNTNCIFYINTIMPFGATLAGRFIKKRVIVHMHETSVQPEFLRNCLLLVVKKFATVTVYVSEFLRTTHPTNTAHMQVVPNSLSNEFVMKGSIHRVVFQPPFRVLMVCSMKKYKGIDAFASLARLIPEFEFTLVLNGDSGQIENWVSQLTKCDNLHVFGPQRDLHPFYSTAHVVLNLSHPVVCVETFGLTALEAMAYGLPVIVPKCGGIAELVEDGVNGYKIDVSDIEMIQSKLQFMVSSPDIYLGFSKNALDKSKQYNCKKQCDDIEDVIFGKVVLPKDSIP